MHFLFHLLVTANSYLICTAKEMCSSFDWGVCPPLIKEEVPDQVSTLLSPPSTPSSFTFSSSPSLPPSRILSPPISERVRPRPYPSTKPSKRDPDSLPQPYFEMWNTPSTMRGASRSVSATGQRTSDEERQAVYGNTMVSYMICHYPLSQLIDTDIGCLHDVKPGFQSTWGNGGGVHWCIRSCSDFVSQQSNGLEPGGTDGAHES